MFYADLSTECMVDGGPQVRAVGWLGKRSGIWGVFGARHQFPTGIADPVFVAKLREHVQTAMEVVLHPAGYHTCEFCKSHAKGLRNVWIPTPTHKYVAPELIVHYIEAHHYLPPQEFIAAVMACPPQGSAEFVRLVNGFENWWKSRPRLTPGR